MRRLFTRRLVLFVTAFIIAFSSLSPAASAQDVPSLPGPPMSTNGVNRAQISSTFDGAGSVVAQGAATALTYALTRLGVWTTPQVTATQKDNWFIVHYRMMRVMGLYVLLPLIVIAIIHSVLKGSLSMLLRSVLVYLPIAILGTAVALDIVQVLLRIIDDFSNLFLASIRNNAANYFSSIINGFSLTAAPLLGRILLAIGIAMASVALYVILVMREGSIYLATSFLPIGFAMLVWPGTAGYFRKLIDLLVGLIVSKLVIVILVSLAIAAFTGGDSRDPGTLGVNGGSVSQSGVSVGADNPVLSWIGRTSSGLALLMLVVFVPSICVGLAANLGIGEMSSSVGQALTRPGDAALRQVLFWDRNITNVKLGRRLAASVNQARDTENTLIHSNVHERRLAQDNIVRNQWGNYSVDRASLQRRGVTDVTLQNEILSRLDPTVNRNNSQMVWEAHRAMRMGDDFRGFEQSIGGTVLRSNTGRDQLLVPISTADGRPLTGMAQNRRAVERVMEDEARTNLTNPARSLEVVMLAPQHESLATDNKVVPVSTRERKDQRWLMFSAYNVASNNRDAAGRAPNIYARFPGTEDVGSVAEAAINK